MENSNKLLNWVNTADDGQYAHFLAGEKITLERILPTVPLVDILKDGVAVIVLWGFKNSMVRIAEMPNNKARWRQFIRFANSGKDIYYFGQRNDITLAGIFGLPECVEATELLAKKEMVVLLLWGKNLDSRG